MPLKWQLDQSSSLKRKPGLQHDALFKTTPDQPLLKLLNSLADPGKAIDNYITDLRAIRQIKFDKKIWRMNGLEIPQERIARRLGETRDVIRSHLAEMPILAKSPNTDLSLGLTIPQVTERHDWSEPMLWSLALEDRVIKHV